MPSTWRTEAGTAALAEDAVARQSQSILLKTFGLACSPSPPSRPPRMSSSAGYVGTFRGGITPGTSSRMASPVTTAVLHATVELLGYCISCSLVNVHNHLVLQVSLKKFYRCSRAAVASNGRGATFIHGNSGRIGRIGGGPGAACSAFLRYWTENFCQVDGGGRVLWPQGRTVKEVLSTTFQDWL